jgi:hypothetical protein
VAASCRLVAHAQPARCRGCDATALRPRPSPPHHVTTSTARLHSHAHQRRACPPARPRRHRLLPRPQASPPRQAPPPRRVKEQPRPPRCKCTFHLINVVAAPSTTLCSGSRASALHMRPRHALRTHGHAVSSPRPGHATPSSPHRTEAAVTTPMPMPLLTTKLRIAYPGRLHPVGVSMDTDAQGPRMSCPSPRKALQLPSPDFVPTAGSVGRCRRYQGPCYGCEAPSGVAVGVIPNLGHHCSAPWAPAAAMSETRHLSVNAVIFI